MGVFACSFLYDGIGIGEHIVDVPGARMTRVSVTEGVVMAHGEGRYSEPAVMASDFAPCEVTSAVNLDVMRAETLPSDIRSTMSHAAFISNI